MSSPTFTELLEDYLATEQAAYVAAVKADYLQAQAEAKQISLRVAKRRIMQATAERRELPT